MTQIQAEVPTDSPAAQIVAVGTYHAHNNWNYQYITRLEMDAGNRALVVGTR